MRIFLLLCSVSVFFSSCMSSNPTFLQYKWTLVSVNDAPVSSGFGLEFKGDEVVGITTCNHIYGDFKARNGYLIFGESRRTSMACEGADFDLEARLHELLYENVDFQETSAGALTLSKAGAIFKFEKAN